MEDGRQQKNRVEASRKYVTFSCSGGRNGRSSRIILKPFGFQRAFYAIPVNGHFVVNFPDGSKCIVGMAFFQVRPLIFYAEKILGGYFEILA